MTLIHLALAFVLRHPAVTAAIIGPRTMEQLESQLGALDVHARRGAARPDRRDRPAGHELQPRRRGLDAAGRSRRRRCADADLQSTASRSTTKTSGSCGLMTPPAPRAP